jgi:hypothetical protein
MLKTKKINDSIVKPIDHVSDKRPWKYKDLFDHPYPRIFLASKSASGKTTVINHILKNCASVLTVVRIFSTTADTDETMVQVIKMLKDNGVTVETFNDLKYDNKNGEHFSDILDKQINQLKNYVNKNREKLKESKFQPVLCIYVFDDFNPYLKYQKSLDNLSTFARHYKCIVLYSTQKFEILSTVAREQINCLILFKNLKLSTLEKIYDDQITIMSFEEFYQLYQQATEKPYSFFYINKNNQTDLRIGFNEQFILD